MSYSQFMMAVIGPGTPGFTVLTIGMTGVVVAALTLFLTSINKGQYATLSDMAGRLGSVGTIAGIILSTLFAVLAVFGIHRG